MSSCSIRANNFNYCQKENKNPTNGQFHTSLVVFSVFPEFRQEFHGLKKRYDELMVISMIKITIKRQSQHGCR